MDIRWMIRRDIEQVMAIESAVFEFPWTTDDFVNVLRRRNSIGLVAVDSKEVVHGYLFYEIRRKYLRLLNVAVHPQRLRIGIGSRLISKIKSRLINRRTQIVLEVRETNLAAQLFFRKHGFRATHILRNMYKESREDLYLMQYSLFDPIQSSRMTLPLTLPG